MRRNILSVICASAIFAQPIFFSFFGLLGIEYEGSDSSPIYIDYIVSIAALNLALYIYSTSKKGLLRGEFFLILSFLSLLALHFLWVIFDPAGTPLIPEFFLFFLLFGLPGFLSAAAAVKLSLVSWLIKVSELFVVLIASGIVAFSVFPLFTGVRVTSLAGASYQTLSYYAAFSFGMLLAHNFIISINLRLKLTSSIVYRLLSYSLMLGCVVACFLGGGRGAFLLLINYLLIGTTSVLLKKQNIITKGGLLNAVYKALSIASIVIIFTIIFGDNRFIQMGFDRATEFISSDGGVDLEGGSSGRDLVYRVALDYIQQQPVLGYGPFAFREKTIHAHNIFLEVFLQFGVVGLFIFLITGAWLVTRIIKRRPEHITWIFFLALYPLTMTMFSGAYMHSSIIFFAASFLFIKTKIKF